MFSSDVLVYHSFKSWITIVLTTAIFFRDLKRDVAKKLEKLEKRTQRAIVELISEYWSLHIWIKGCKLTTSSQWMTFMHTGNLQTMVYFIFTIGELKERYCGTINCHKNMKVLFCGQTQSVPLVLSFSLKFPCSPITILSVNLPVLQFNSLR